MSSWLEQFAASVDAIGNGRNLSSSDSAKAIANRYLAMKDAKRLDPTTGGVNWDGSSGGSNIGKSAWSGAQWLLDKVERPMEGLANVFDQEAITSTKKNVSFGDKAADVFNPKNIGSAFLEGLSGKKKTTYSEVLKDAGVTDSVALGVGGFVGDVALDPLTYVGPGAVKGAVKLGAKLTGQSEHLAQAAKYSRAKNPFGKTADVNKAAGELESTGSAVVEDSNVARVLKDSSNKYKAKTEAEIMPTETSAAGEATDELVTAPSKGQLSATVHHDLVTKHHGAMTSGIDSWRYPGAKISPTSVRSPIKEVPTPAPALAEGGKAADAAAQGGKQVIPEAIPKSVPARPNNVIADEHIGKLKTVQNGNIALYNRKGGAFPFTRTPAKKGVPSDAVPHIDKSVIHRLIIQGSNLDKKAAKIPEELEDYYVGRGKELVSLKKVVQDGVSAIHAEKLAAKTKAAGAVTSNTAKLVEKPFDIMEPSPLVKAEPKLGPARKFNDAEWTKWTADNAHIRPDDIEYIRNGGPKTVRAVEARRKEILESTDLVDYPTLKELGIAFDAGKITDVGSEVHYAAREAANLAMGKSGPKESWSSVFDSKLTKAQAKLATYTSKPGPAAAAKVEEAKAEIKTLEETTPASEKPVMDDPEVMKVVDAKVEATAGGDVSWAAGISTDLSPVQKAAVVEAVKNMNWKQFGDAIANPEKFYTKTLKDTPRTSKELGKGEGPIQAVNKMAQMNLGMKLIKRAELIAGKKSPENAAALYDTLMPMLRESDNVIRGHGLDIVMGKNPNAIGLPLSTHDLLSSLPREFVEKIYLSGHADLSITQMLDVGELYVRQHLGQLADGYLTKRVASILTEGDPSSRITQQLGKTPGNLGQVMGDIDAAFNGAVPDLITKLTNNYSAEIVKLGEDTEKMSRATIEAFNSIIDAPNAAAGSVIEAVTNADKLVVEAAKGLKVPPSAKAVVAAKEALVAEMDSKVNVPQILAVAKGTEKFAKATTSNEITKILVENVKSNAVTAERIGQEMLAAGDITTFDLGMKAEFNRAITTFAAFMPHLGQPSLRPLLLDGVSINQRVATEFSSMLNEIGKSFKPEELNEAMGHLSLGTKATTPAQEAMQSIFNSLDGLAERNGVTQKQLLEHLETKHFPNYLKIDPKSISSSWKQWQSKDILTDLSKYFSGMSEAIAHRQVGAEISSMFGKVDNGPGLVRVIDPHGKSRIASLIDTSKFYPEDIVRQLHMFDRTLEQVAKEKGSGPVWRVLDSAIHSWKAGLTIYNPQHHVRNMVGDVWLSSMDGVKASAYKKSLAAMHASGETFKDFDTKLAMQDAFKTTGGAAPDALVSLKYRGELVHLNAVQVKRIIDSSGILKKYSVIEDISQTANEADRVASTLQKVSPLRLIGQGGKIHSLAANVSEGREHYVRIAHFIHALEDGAKKGGLKGESLDIALKRASQDAAHRVNKWHPDGSDMTAGERKYARRAILFYSWQRKAIPLIIEAAVMRPGKLLAYNKAMYNMAESNGVDLNGYGNSFPSDQLFPSYIADSVQGPTWGHAGAYMGMKPGIPSLDLSDQYATNPSQTLKTILSSSNPLIKVPFEVATGTNVGTGAKIPDKSDYADSQIPFAGRAASITGRSLTGLGQPKHVAKTNENYEGNPESKIPGTDKKISPEWMSFLNWLDGLAVTDYSKPSSGVAAQRENQRLSP